jgi:chemotaxis protein methyltransferase WspC
MTLPNADFASLLRRTMGLDAMSIGLSAIESAVKSRMKSCELKDSEKYWGLLQNSEAEVQELIEAVIVPETWFFREREAFSALISVMKGTWLPANPGGKLRLLSLPCSTGEEPYSITMAMLEAGLPEGLFQVDAVDISTRSLARAQRGIYGKNSFRGQNIAFRDRFFEPTEQGFRIIESVRQEVRFLHGNMLDPQFMPEKAVYDYIFCRNVLIYFDQDAQDSAVRMLDRLLKPGGMLFVGPSESGLLMSHGFASAQFPLAFAFHRKPVAQKKSGKAAVDSLPMSPHKTRSAIRPTVPLVRPVHQPQLKVAPQAKVAPQDSLDEISQLADQGRLQEAMRRCEDALRVGPSARVFYLMGLIHDANGNLTEAEQYYRKALYLEPGHHEAIIHLAFLKEQQGDLAGARQLHQRAKRVDARG